MSEKFRFGLKILWVKERADERTHCGKFIAEKDILVKNVKKTQQQYQNMGCPIFSKLPTPLVRFCPVLLDPPIPPKIGHHLCMFPNIDHQSHANWN